MNKAIIVLSGILILAGATSGYDLPEVLCYIEPPNLEEESWFGLDFCCVGDQNQDGFDDLLIIHDPWSPQWGERGYANQVEMYHGGERMDDEIDFAFTIDRERTTICRKINYLGNILPGDFPYIAITLLTWPEQNWARPESVILHLYESVEDLDNEPEYMLGSLFREGNIYVCSGHRTRPADLNGDGFHDMIAMQECGDYSKVLAFFGGEEFDTIPDWEAPIEYPWTLIQGSQYSSGCDINGDGYDDLMVKWARLRPGGADEMYSMYLGGESMDTIPVFELNGYHFENILMRHGFSLLPDVNGDGYDDWGIHAVREGGWVDGYFLFFGSEEPDMEPDIVLSGNNAFMGYEGDLTGGDFNGDGYGDIVTSHWGGFHEDGEIHIHFGSPWIDGEPEILINGARDYGREYRRLGYFVGAAGDYNGDGIDDFVARIKWVDEWEDPRMVVFAGNRDWRVDVPIHTQPESFQLSLTAFPNPFNNRTMLEFTMPQDGNARLAIYDLKGKEAGILADTHLQRGDHRYFLINRTAGVYFAVLRTDSGTEIVKMVCLM